MHSRIITNLTASVTIYMGSPGNQEVAGARIPYMYVFVRNYTLYKISLARAIKKLLVLGYYLCFYMP